MGWRTVVDVRDNSAARGSAYTVAIMLAERAPDETRIARPGIDLLAHDSRVDKRTCQRALKTLEELREIVRISEGRRGHAAEFYIAVGAQGDNLPPKVRAATDPDTVASTTPKGVEKGGRNDTPTEVPTSVRGKTEPKEPKSVGFAADAARLADLLEAKVNEIAETPGRKRVSERWIAAIERLMRIDGRTAEQVHFVITWLGGPTEGGQFWGANVQSGPKLRAKFDQLVARIKLERRNGNGRSVGRSGEDLRAMASKLREAGN